MATPEAVVLDANILIAALIRDGYVRRLILLSRLPLFIPETALVEAHRNKEYIRAKSGVPFDAYCEALNAIISRLRVIPLGRFQEHLPSAAQMMQSIHESDAPILAAALSIPGSIIWSDDNDLKRQHLVPVFSTEEITSHLLDID